VTSSTTRRRPLVGGLRHPYGRRMDETLHEPPHEPSQVVDVRRVGRLATVHTLALVGVDAVPVRLECAVTQGLPGLRLVGLPDVAVRESGERVRAAIRRVGLRWPALRIVVNLAPADLPKAGSGFDLPLALGILAASGQLEPGALDGIAVHGEVGLDGTLRGVPAALAVAVGARRLGMTTLLMPADGAAVTVAVEGLTVWPARDLPEAIAFVLRRTSPPDPASLDHRPRPHPTVSAVPDLRDVRGQPAARRAVEVAAAGGHHLLLVGPPGCGKSMLAARLPGLLPDLTPDESLDVATIHSLVGGDHAVPLRRPPVRAPLAGVSAAALLGAGTGAPRPGELSLAHHGVLVMDELLESPRPVLDALRQPLEDGRVVIDRARGRTVLPARVQLVATTNPCPCGMLGHPRHPCTCRPDRRERYRARLSGPLLDRIDIRLTLRPVPRERLTGAPDGESTAAVATRVRAARAVAAARQGRTLNRDVAFAVVQRTAGTDALRLLADGLDTLGVSARAFERCLRVARTLADLAATERIGEEQVAEAMALRGPAFAGAST
jgi:magnesium chelatase family protein